MLAVRLMLLFLACWFAPIIRKELSWISRVPEGSPCEESKGRLGIGIVCILGLLGTFLLRLETLSFCSSAFYLDCVY